MHWKQRNLSLFKYSKQFWLSPPFSKRFFSLECMKRFSERVYKVSVCEHWLTVIFVTCKGICSWYFRNLYSMHQINGGAVVVFVVTSAAAERIAKICAMLVSKFTPLTWKLYQWSKRGKGEKLINIIWKYEESEKNSTEMLENNCICWSKKFYSRSI